MTIATFDMNARRSAGSKSIASATAWSNSCAWSSSGTAASLAAHVAYPLRGRCSWLHERRARPPVSLRCCDGEGLREAEEVTEEAAAKDTQGTPLREAGGEEVRLRLAVSSMRPLGRAGLRPNHGPSRQIEERSPDGAHRTTSGDRSWVGQSTP